MEIGWKPVLAALLLGIIIPQVMVSLGSRAGRQGAPDPQQTLPQTEPVIQTDAPASAEPEENAKVYLPVQTGENSVCVMELEAYTLGVLLAEMPASFEEEALKAQAVVARTYALRRLTLWDKHLSAAICTESYCCQAYLSPEEYLLSRGTQQDIDKISSAVRKTQGLVLTYQGALAEATYYACSGGRTEDAAAVWGADIPYLQAVDSPGEEHAQGYRDTVYFKSREFADALGRTMTGAPASWLGKVTYTQGGGVASMMIGGISYSGTQLRQMLKLNSTAFTMTADEGGITVTTRGKGHRVGMSQYGADAMAVTGCSYDAILAHYYPGTVIDKFPNIG